MVQVTAMYATENKRVKSLRLYRVQPAETLLLVQLPKQNVNTFINIDWDILTSTTNQAFYLWSTGKVIQKDWPYNSE